MYHFDFYRVKDAMEAMDFGYEEYFFGGDRCFIEWPEKVEERCKIISCPMSTNTRTDSGVRQMRFSPFAASFESIFSGAIGVLLNGRKRWKS